MGSLRCVCVPSSVLVPALLLLSSMSCRAPVSRVDSKPGPRPGQSRTDVKSIEQVWVPPGKFLMGADEATLAEIKSQNPPAWVLRESPSESPQHEVHLTAGYWIDRDEVTNRAFEVFVQDGGYTNRGYWSDAGWQWLATQDRGKLPAECGRAPDLPRTCVTWHEAEAYARWRRGRLPTEAEWEFAARGPASRRYPWGDEFDASRCNVVDSQGPKPVGSYPGGNSWVGARDMAGNAMEWVSDWLAAYDPGTVENPTGPAIGKVKVEKGGWWGSSPLVARCSYRHYEDPPEYGDKHIGFRVVTPKDAP